MIKAVLVSQKHFARDFKIPSAFRWRLDPDRFRFVPRPHGNEARTDWVLWENMLFPPKFAITLEISGHGLEPSYCGYGKLHLR